MSRLDSTILDLEDSAQDIEAFTDFSLDPQSPKLASAVFGSARQRSISKVSVSSRRDSPTLPWRNPSRLAKRDTAKSIDAVAAPKVQRPDSPDISDILAKTPRPRKSSSSVLTGSAHSSQSRSPQSLRSSKAINDDESLISDYGALLDDELDDAGSESDSSLDIHTPLPHLMFRDGLLSPRSKLLPQDLVSTSPYSHSNGATDSRSTSVLSLASTAGSVMTGLHKDPRHTERRRVRHRDGRLLRAGMGLTTGLGWSDSEDEDAPSPLTRRLIATTVDRQRSGSVNSPSRPTSLYTDVPTSRFTSPVPFSKLSHKPMSHSNLRSASISFPSKVASPATGLRFPRGRAASASTSSTPLSTSSIIQTSPVASPPLGMTRLPTESREALTKSPDSMSKMPLTSPTSRSPDIKPKTSLPRPRTVSNASVTSTTTATSHRSQASRTTTSPVPTLTSDLRKPRVRTDSVTSNSTKTSASHNASTSHALPDISRSTMSPLSTLISDLGSVRPRTESTTSNSTTTTTSNASSYSQYSQNSSSTASSTSTVPRPLRLPLSAGIKSPVRSFSQGTSGPVISRSQSEAFLRQRTGSIPSIASVMPISEIRTTSNSLSSGVLPAGAPPTLRQRQTPNGARPRTGTGMVYRTSSAAYSSFQESGSKMRDLQLATGLNGTVAV